MGSHLSAAAEGEDISKKNGESHITLEKSSKTIFPCFKKAPQRATHAIPPTSSQVATAHFPRGGRQSAVRGCDFYSRNSLAGGEGGGRGNLQNDSIMDHWIDCKFSTKIDNSILLLCYLDKICLILTGGLWQASYIVEGG